LVQCDVLNGAKTKDHFRIINEDVELKLIYLAVIFLTLLTRVPPSTSSCVT
jgi:hypothetical protein